MDRIDRKFRALSKRMSRLSHAGRVSSATEPLTSLIDKLDAAKQRYQPGTGQ